jgi:hypothetical protein
MDDHDEHHEHTDIFIAVFNKKGVLKASDELCSCKLPYLDMRGFPYGCSISILTIPTSIH